MSFHRSQYLLVSVVLLIASCQNPVKLLTNAQAATKRFYARLDQGQIDATYKDTTAGFRTGTDSAAWRAIVERIHRNTGKCGIATQRGTNVSALPTGVFVTLTTQRTCDNGLLDEVFTWQMSGDDWRLHAYRVGGSALMGK